MSEVLPINSLESRVSNLVSSTSALGKKLLDFLPRVLPQIRERHPDVTPSGVAQELLNVHLENNNGKGVLVYEPDEETRQELEARLRNQGFRVNGFSDGEGLQEFVDNRLSNMYFFAGIVQSKAEADPCADDDSASELIERIFDANQNDCVRITRQSGRLEYQFKGYDPTLRGKELSSVHKLFKREVDHLFKLGTSTESMDAELLPNVSTIQDQTEHAGERAYKQAERLREEGYFSQAAQKYWEAFTAEKSTNASPFARYAGLLLRRDMRSQLNELLPEEYRPRVASEAAELEGLAQLIKEKFDDFGSDELRYLYGKAQVHVYWQRQKNGEGNVEQLQDAIEQLRSVTGPDDKHRLNMDAQESLVLGLVLEGSEQSLQEAYEIVEWTIKHSDPVAHGISSNTGLSNEIAQMVTREGGGSSLMQLTGLNRVFRLRDYLIVKKFIAPENLQRAINEAANYADLDAHRGKFTMSIEGKKQQIKLPDWAVLVSKPPANQLTDEKTVVYEIMPRMDGNQAAKAMEKITVPETNPKKEKFEGIKQRHLEWIIDAGARLQAIGTTYFGRLYDTRDEQQTLQVNGQEWDVGFYTRRVYKKLIEGEARPSFNLAAGEGRRQLTQQTQQEVLCAVQEFEAYLKENTPGFLWLFYTDNNLRNYLLDFSGDDSDDHAAWVSSTEKGRIDLENRDLRVGMADALTGVEHELAKMDTDTADYLMDRWLARIITDHIPVYWARVGCTPEQQEAYDVFTAQAEAVLDGARDSREISSVLEEFLPRIEKGLTLKTYRNLCRVDSLLRHMTIVGDKYSERALMDRVLGQFKENHPELNSYEPVHDWTREFKEKLFDRSSGEGGGEKSDIKLSFSYLNMFREKTEAALEHHIGYVKQRLDECGKGELVSKLSSEFGWG